MILVAPLAAVALGLGRSAGPLLDWGVIAEEVLLNFLMWLPVLIFEVVAHLWMARMDAGFHEAMAEREREFQREQAAKQMEHEEALLHIGHELSSAADEDR